MLRGDKSSQHATVSSIDTIYQQGNIEFWREGDRLALLTSISVEFSHFLDSFLLETRSFERLLTLIPPGERLGHF